MRVAPGRLLHVEYQRDATADLAARMIRYRGAIATAHPGTSLTQVVVVLGDGYVPSADDPETGFHLGLNVLYLRDCDPEDLLRHPTTAPMAVLARGDSLARAITFTRAVELIQQQPEALRERLSEAAAVLATIRLDRPTIEHITKETHMTIQTIADWYSDNPIGQELLDRGVERGLERGLERGHAEERQAFTEALTAVLNNRFGLDPHHATLAAHLSESLDKASAITAVTTATTIDDLELT